MSEKPILFSGEMVRAILDGRKTMTRRVIKPQPTDWTRIYSTGQLWPAVEKRGMCELMECPYGQPGDRLWVREAWKPVPITAYRCSEGVQQTPNPHDSDEAAVYRCGWDRSSGGVPWRPSIHMPRWASRITLEIISVRAERLQDITEADAMAEGVKALEYEAYHVAAGFGACMAFEQIWDSLHGPGAWATNTEVAVLQFRVARGNIDA
jgi:hypothetical protein